MLTKRRNGHTSIQMLNIRTVVIKLQTRINLLCPHCSLCGIQLLILNLELTMTLIFTASHWYTKIKIVLVCVDGVLTSMINSLLKCKNFLILVLQHIQIKFVRVLLTYLKQECCKRNRQYQNLQMFLLLPYQKSWIILSIVLLKQMKLQIIYLIKSKQIKQLLKIHLIRQVCKLYQIRILKYQKYQMW